MAADELSTVLTPKMFETSWLTTEETPKPPAAVLEELDATVELAIEL